MYFKKAINESENEFESQNKALIDTRGVRKLSSKSALVRRFSL